MSTQTLDKVNSYVGSDATPSAQANEYDFSYAYGSFKDNPFSVCYDPYSLAQEYCAGEHLLMAVTPKVFQNNTANTLKGVTFGYSSPLHNTYYDSLHKTSNGSQQYSGQTYWQYLNFYEDLNSGVGGRISYATAYNIRVAPPPSKMAMATSPTTVMMRSIAPPTLTIPTLPCAARATTPIPMTWPGLSRS